MRLLLLAPVRIYQILSSLSAPACKFYPSCSTYAMVAIKRYGLKGLVMTLQRLGRCHPWSHGGVDYVDSHLDSADAQKTQDKLSQNQSEKEVVGAK
jgi:putative membrane protein insertion efficiency factor